MKRLIFSLAILITSVSFSFAQVYNQTISSSEYSSLNQIGPVDFAIHSINESVGWDSEVEIGDVKVIIHMNLDTGKLEADYFNIAPNVSISETVISEGSVENGTVYYQVSAICFVKYNLWIDDYHFILNCSGSYESNKYNN